ncbi:hypothetical protein CsSME_00042420 [Camellia sinensis var. sinensis]
MVCSSREGRLNSYQWWALVEAEQLIGRDKAEFGLKVLRVDMVTMSVRLEVDVLEPLECMPVAMFGPKSVAEDNLWLRVMLIVYSPQRQRGLKGCEEIFYGVGHGMISKIIWWIGMQFNVLNCGGSKRQGKTSFVEHRTCGFGLLNFGLYLSLYLFHKRGHVLHLGIPFLGDRQKNQIHYASRVGTIDYFKRRRINGPIDRGIVSKFSQKKLIFSTLRMIPHKTSEQVPKALVYHFCLSIGLRMNASAKMQVGANLLLQSPSKMSEELGIHIRHNRNGNRMKLIVLFEEVISHIGSIHSHVGQLAGF